MAIKVPRAIILRLLYNNSQYRAKCRFPDPLCWKCMEARLDLDQGRPLKVNITPPRLDDKDCSGSCWESALLNNNLDWGNDQRFRNDIAGVRAYLVFEQRNERNRIGYRLWGSTTVSGVNMPSARATTKYRYWIKLQPFEPLPSTKWSRVLSDKELIGSSWRQGFYRYIYDAGREAFLESLASGTSYIEATGELRTITPTAKEATDGLLAAHIEEKIQQIASNHGRTRDEIIRQAVAEWLKRQE